MKNTVHWFRTKGLRLHDNPALLESIEKADTLRCVFILDPYFASSNNGVNKWRFLLQCLTDLDSCLRKFNSRLFVVKGQPADLLPKLFKQWKTTCFSFEEDPEPFGRVRDQNIITQCQQLGIEVILRPSHTLYSSEMILGKNGGNPPLTYRQFLEIVRFLPPPPLPYARPNILPHTPLEPQFNEKYAVPTLEELGFLGFDPRATQIVWSGGETEALRRLERHLERKVFLATVHGENERKPKLTAESLIASETGISPYLRFGCLSTRLFFYKLKELYQNLKKVDPPLSLYAQIFWREFFYVAATRNPNFDKMVGNGICLQIPWDKNPEALMKWSNGQTGFPFIDAIMIQLRKEGWIHHLARHVVASFLTRGDLWISWEEGMKVFDELLLDADLVMNAGSWLWYSSSSFFQPFFHCLCPVKFGRRTDPNGDYIRKYIPVLRYYPREFIHEPWSAPQQVQFEARCIIGQDYPLPMVCHSTAYKINMERMRQVFSSLNKYVGSNVLNPGNHSLSIQPYVPYAQNKA